LLSLALSLLLRQACTIVPFFPANLLNIISLALFFIGFWNIRIAVDLSIVLFGLSVGYHSYSLLIIYTYFAFLIARVFSPYAVSPQVYILVMCAPVLATLKILNVHLPLEFLVVFLIPCFVPKERALAFTFMAVMFTAMAGVITHKAMIGNLLLGAPSHGFYYRSLPASPTLDFRWMVTLFKPSLFFHCGLMVKDMVLTLLNQPIILYQAAIWGFSSYVIALGIEWRIQRNKRHFTLLATGIAAVLVGGLYVAVPYFYPEKIPFNLTALVLRLVAGSAIFWVSWEIIYTLGSRSLTQKVKPSSQFIQDIAEREVVRKKDMSLEDTLKMQTELQDYIKKKFSQKVTALDIDIADSTKIKNGEPKEAIIFSFTEYWKVVDLVILPKGGRLLNRAGDGAIYLFGDPDKAVEAARQTLKELVVFNQKTKTIKGNFAIRVGLNSGEIIEDPDRKNADIFSDVLDIAGHLQKMAKNNQVLISETTYQELKNKGLFESEGKSEKDNILTYTLRS
jgi:class 3 adenylate cyclase